MACYSITRESQFHNSKREKQHKVLQFLAAITLTIFFGLPSLSIAQPPLEWAEGRILVQPRAGLSDEEFNRVLQRSRGKSKTKIGKLNVHIVEVPPQAELVVARALSRNPHIKFAEVDFLIEADFFPNDPIYSSQWHLPMIQAPIAWDSTQGEGITVAVLDTGVDSNHPDLQDHMTEGRNSVSGNSDTADIHGHGTAVAGTIGAVLNNSTAVAGVAGNVSLMPIRISNRSDGFAYASDIAAGLTWAADQGARVANISYALTGTGSTVTNGANYFRNSGGIVVVSAGNDGNNPGVSEDPSMITVSATTQSDVRASWSNYGNFVDIAAPGDFIYTTNRGGGTGPWSGTSFSAPVAAGVVALIMAQNPNLSPVEVEAVLEDSADDLGSSLYYGAGRVNAANAVQMAGNISGGGDSQRPTVAIINPVRDAVVNGWVTVDVTAVDNMGVNRVVLFAGGVQVGQDTVAPFQFSWNSSTVNDGITTLIAYAYDAANNEGSSGAHPVNVDNVPDIHDSNPPTVSIANPSNGSIVSRTVQIRVYASDDVNISSVKLYIDGALRASSNISPLDYSWNTRKVSSGDHRIKAVAVDGASNNSETQINVLKGSSSGSKGGGRRKK